MPRVARKKAESGIYHIIMRGNNLQTIFYDSEDYEVFLNRIKLIKEKYDFCVYAFCLMNNHIHMLIKEKEISISKIIQAVLTSYIHWYNKKYERVGNLFQDRYKSEPIETDEYLICAARYIHQNPIKAGIEKEIGNYKWSSYNSYLNDKESFVDTQFILDILGGKESYIRFMNDHEGYQFIEFEGRKNISDEKLCKIVSDILKSEKIQDLKLLEKEKLIEILNKIYKIGGISMQQISRITGVSMGIVRQLG